jgi:superfamily II DNA or RNA helicase
MTDDVVVKKINSVWLQVDAEPSTKQELSEYFEFYAPNYKFMPAYKKGIWDGKIRMFNVMTGRIYTGLLVHILKFCRDRKYTITVDSVLSMPTMVNDDFGYRLAKDFKAPFVPRDYQNNAVVHGINNRRALFLSPTASGKSFIIYLLSRYYVERGAKVLIIVPTISLVSQMATDFIQYNNGKRITTWQSIQRIGREFYEKYSVVIGDEAHQFKAKSLTSIMEKTPHIEYKFGFTGTVDDIETNKLTLQGLFGSIKKVISTKQLIEEKTLSQFDIKALILKYSEEDRKENAGKTYAEEIDWIVRNEKRNQFIKKLAGGLAGNTLVLFQFVEKHGKDLYTLFNDVEQNVHYVSGEVSGDERETIRALVEKSDNNIIIASFGTFSTGINIVNLDNIVFASPSKSKIRNLQSIGRVLRKKDDESQAILYDIVDDLSYGKRTNFAIKHFSERVQIYNDEDFNYKIYNIDF